MFKNYFLTAWRNLKKNKGSSFINIGGLAIGMTVALLIGLWIDDELSFNKSFANYARIGQVMQHQTVNGEVYTGPAVPVLMGQELRAKYGENFSQVVMSSWEREGILLYGEKAIAKNGIYMEPGAPSLLSLKMIQGNYRSLEEPHSVILAASTAKALFGEEDAMNKTLKIENKLDAIVTGIYEDMPMNSDFYSLQYISTWELYTNSEEWIKYARDNAQWNNNSFQAYVQLAEGANFDFVNKNIVHSKQVNVAAEDKKYNAQIFLLPMSDWHLRSNWENGIQTGGSSRYVWLFGTIGVFVLLLACINFMNLSTARSEKRAREVGVRKAVGSMRKQLIAQFYCESLLVVLFAFAVSLLFSVALLPWFNQVAGKQIQIPWGNGWAWSGAALFIGFTSLLAGSYPALYLSSFKPVRVLKGTFKVGRMAAVPRKALVVLQFTISLVLIIATLVVHKQLQYSKNRPVGYDRNGLLMIAMKTPDFYGKFDLLETELKATGAVLEFSESSSPVTQVWSNNNGFDWEGKDPGLDTEFASVWVTTQFGKTVNWQFKEGRDFSKQLASDSAALVLNEAAVNFMHLKDPVGKTITWQDGKFHVIGVIKDMLMDSPYDPVSPTVYFHTTHNVNWINLKLNPEASISGSLGKIEAIFKKLIPSVPFDYKFADTEFASKFADEVRVGTLSSLFAGLAIFISCLGLFGLASFMAEQRVREIGVRKVLGASVFNLWNLLSRDFLLLILVSILIAIPVAYYFMHNWLQSYSYRTDLSWWIFSAAGIGGILITLATVSYQSIRAAMANPVKSLRTE